MTILAIGFACVALGVAVYAALRVHRLSIGSDTPQVQPYDDGDVWTALEGVANEIPGLRAEYAEFKAMVTTAVAEGIQHVERAENRIKATVRRARRELEDGGVRSPGLEAEARDLFDDDAGGGPSEAVPPVHDHVGGSPAWVAAVPGALSPAHLSRMTGRNHA